MSFMKLFQIGYFIFLIAMGFVYFFVPNDYAWITIVILCLLFGVYQMIVRYRLRRKQV